LKTFIFPAEFTILS